MATKRPHSDCDEEPPRKRMRASPEYESTDELSTADHSTKDHSTEASCGGAGDCGFRRPCKDRLEDLYHQGVLLGQGGFGSVYAGTRKSDGLPVAIKYVTRDEEELKVPGLDDPIPLEVALMMHVSHETSCANVLKLLDWFEGLDEYIMILERPDPCQDLFQFCKSKGGFLSEDLARHVVAQVLQALRHCEKHNVLHRDLKPENLLIELQSLQVKLIDFGCGDIWRDSVYTEFAGTEDYTPPEWFLSQKYRAGPCTVWSLGVTLYQLVCGYLPFPTKRAAIRGRIKFPPSVSPDCRNLIRQCLKRKAADRLTMQQIKLHPWLQHC
ncbi:serine/threonine-protein kinase pim-1-like isoform X1 [Paramormyrops kingsleyae]|uniref:serine/threonine-protein kinase pim-1-like isoform X1 n=1 Tax=Paramormyrops kingsleyae TaxID=1676925 RepID=UPI003B970850